MSLGNALRHARRPIAVTVAALMLTAVGTLVGAAPQYSISQKGREFHPGDVTIKRGESIQIVNDDADLLHHAYVDSDKFSFDSGDQKPGSARRSRSRWPATSTCYAPSIRRCGSWCTSNRIVDQAAVDQRIAVPNSSACPT